MSEPGRLSRRTLLRSAGLLAAGVGAGVGGRELAGGRARTGDRDSAIGRAAPRSAGHQPGIDTPAPAHLQFAAFDVVVERSRDLAALLSRWSATAAELGRGGGASGTAVAAAAVEVTLGFGPSLFDGRFGLAERRPPGFASLPAFAGDQLDPARSGGDLMLQVCGEDPVAVHAVLRLLTASARGAAWVRWTQRGFGTSAHERTRATPRNLLGQKDGTGNPVPGTARFDEAVWLPADAEPAWLRGGSFLVARRIRLALDAWDATPPREQERVIGRTLGEGGPLSGGGELEPPDFGRRGPDGSLLIPADSHVRLSNPAFYRGAVMFRRGYSYDDGLDAVGRPDAGLFFLAYVRDVAAQFVPVQRRLAEADALNCFTTTLGGAVFVVPPSAAPGGYLGQGLLA